MIKESLVSLQSACLSHGLSWAICHKGRVGLSVKSAVSNLVMVGLSVTWPVCRVACLSHGQSQAVCHTGWI